MSLILTWPQWQAIFMLGMVVSSQKGLIGLAVRSTVGAAAATVIAIGAGSGTMLSPSAAPRSA